MVKRWRVKWDETEVPDGEYVRAADHDEIVGKFLGYHNEDKARLKLLETSLLEFSRHKSDCQRHGRDQCTCGFKAMIRTCFSNTSAGGE